MIQTIQSGFRCKRFLLFLSVMVLGILLTTGCSRRDKSDSTSSTSGQDAPPSMKKLDEHSYDLEYMVQNYKPQLKKAYAQVNNSASKYHVVKVLEREARLKDSPKSYTRLLILIEDSGLVESHAFSEPDLEGKELGYVESRLGKTFWVDNKGNVTFDMDNPLPKSSLVAEFYVENKMPVVSFYAPESLPILINLKTQP